MPKPTLPSPPAALIAALQRGDVDAAVRAVAPPKPKRMGQAKIGAAAVLAALALAACAQVDFYKSGASMQDKQKDLYECERDARQVMYGRYEDPMAFFVRCMAARGWTAEVR